MQASTFSKRNFAPASVRPRVAQAASVSGVRFQPAQNVRRSAPVISTSSGQRDTKVVAKAASDATAEGFQWGANMKNLGISVAAGVLLYLAPTPEGVTTQAWKLLAVFVSTIIGIITQPLPLGAVAMLGLGAAMITKTLTFAQAFSAFSSQIPCASCCPLAWHEHIEVLLNGSSFLPLNLACRN